jgi:hypothetical protein
MPPFLPLRPPHYLLLPFLLLPFLLLPFLLLPFLLLPYLLLPFLLFLLATTLQGCGGDSQPPSSVAVRAEAPLVLCPGAELATLTTVVYVAPAGADSDSCGDKPATPCASIAKGIARCSVAGCAVAVRHGLYPSTATITLRDAVSVHGSCRFGDEPDHFYRTVIDAAPPAGEPAIAATGINSATALTGVVVIARNETAAGEASIAMRVGASRGLTLGAVTLAAGRGGDGAAGASKPGGPGGGGGSPATLFDLGLGGAACPSSPPPAAGNGGAGRDANRFSIQGAGCGPDCNCAADASGLLPGQLAGQSSGKARGGAAGGNGPLGGNCVGHPSLGPTPGNGGGGLAGEIGDCTALGGPSAVQSTLSGTFVAGRWAAGHGGAGSAGGAGSGGGGGGAGGYSTWVPFIGATESYYGFPGGGGGGGGCGGEGGGGGQQGGASIPLVLVDAGIAGLADGASLVPGPGGSGGAGGAGGAGGPGGVAGNAFNGSKVSRPYVVFPNVAMPGAGGGGGPGGPGGAGAGGAGGNGGPSFGLALLGNSPDPSHDGVYAGTPGAAGAQGPGGANPLLAGNSNSQCRSGDGQNGLPGAGAPANRYTQGS